MDENLKRFLEELQKKQERLAQPAERLTLEALYEEAYDFDMITIYNHQAMLERMEEIGQDLIALEYYHLVVYVVSLFYLVKQEKFKTPCSTIHDLSRHHLGELADLAGLKWSQMEALLLGDGSAHNLWKVVIAFDWLGCQVPNLWRSRIIIDHVWGLFIHSPDLLRAKRQTLYLQLTAY